MSWLILFFARIQHSKNNDITKGVNSKRNLKTNISQVELRQASQNPMGIDARKPVFRVGDHIRFNPASTVTDTR